MSTKEDALHQARSNLIHVMEGDAVDWIITDNLIDAYDKALLSFTADKIRKNFMFHTDGFFHDEAANFIDPEAEFHDGT